jgi:lysophospholipase L1-like esterase
MSISPTLLSRSLQYQTVRANIYYFLILAVASLARAETVSIMPLGDSITAGYTGAAVNAPGGYRNNLYADLTAAGIPIVFVGSSVQNSSPLLLAANQTRNEGHSGLLIQGVPLAGYPGGFYPGLYENIDTWFSAFQPDIVLLMIGTNDINMDIDLPDAPARLGALLDKITSDAPNARIVLSTLILTLDPSLNSAVQTFNAALPGVVTSRSKVTLVDNSNVLDLSTDYASTLHPNQQGYNKLGDALASEVEDVLTPELASPWLVGLGLALLATMQINRPRIPWKS